MPSTAQTDIATPKELPFLESIFWFDCKYRDLTPLEMLRRYESGWRFLGVLADPSEAEKQFIRELVARFGSVIDVPP
jgi:hypothetical protein